MRNKKIPQELETCRTHIFCRGGRTRTGDLFDPNEARYQTAPHPELAKIIEQPVYIANRTSHH